MMETLAFQNKGKQKEAPPPGPTRFEVAKPLSPRRERQKPSVPSSGSSSPRLPSVPRQKNSMPPMNFVSAPMTPIPVREPEQFDGNSDSFQAWLFSVDTFFTFRPIPSSDAKCLLILNLLTKGEAAKWAGL